MMNYLKLLFFVGVFALLSACCQKKNCLGVDAVNEIRLVNFTPGEADSIVVKRYQKNSDFQTLVDSFNTVGENFQSIDSSLAAYMGSSLNINYDYQIIFPNIFKTYLLTDFSVKKQECNSCFPFGHDNVTVLESYLVNGEKENLYMMMLQITK